MKTQYYRYPRSIRISKINAKIMFLLAFVMLAIGLFRILLGGQDSFAPDAKACLFLASFMLLLTLYIGSWSNVDIDDDGLLIEFFLGKLRVRWDEVISIHHFGPKKYFGVWTVIVAKNALTPFHYLYGLFATFSINPGFHIHDDYGNFQTIIGEIDKNRRNHLKRKQ